MHNSLKALLPAVALCTMLGCPPAPSALSPADREANRALSLHFAQLAVAKDFDGVAKLYTDSALMLPPNTPVLKGRTAIKGFMAAFPPLSELTITIDTLVGTGDRAYASGRYHLTLAIQGSPVDSGKFLDIREKQGDGSWLYVADMFNSNIPEPAAH
jgi:ketosteroid isomerase-like protein